MSKDIIVIKKLEYETDKKEIAKIKKEFETLGFDVVIVPEDVDISVIETARKSD